MFVLTESMKVDAVSDHCGHFDTSYPVAEVTVVLHKTKFYKCGSTCGVNTSSAPSFLLHVKLWFTFICHGILENIVRYSRTCSVKQKVNKDHS